MLPTEMQILAGALHKACEAMTEQASTMCLGALNPKNANDVLVSIGRSSLVEVRRAEFEARRLHELADVHADTLRGIYNQTISLVDMLRLWGGCMEPSAQESVMSAIGRIQTDIEGLFPGEGMPTGD